MSPPLPDPTRGDVVISVGPDGRLYFHDLDPELIELALAVNPADELMRRRLALCRNVEGAAGGATSGSAATAGAAREGTSGGTSERRDSHASDTQAACVRETAP